VLGQGDVDILPMDEYKMGDDGMQGDEKKYKHI
jgi:hypothetical protein